jgi:hypothetical protein
MSLGHDCSRKAESGYLQLGAESVTVGQVGQPAGMGSSGRRSPWPKWQKRVPQRVASSLQRL